MVFAYVLLLSIAFILVKLGNSKFFNLKHGYKKFKLERMTSYPQVVKQ